SYVFSRVCLSSISPSAPTFLFTLSLHDALPIYLRHLVIVSFHLQVFDVLLASVLYEPFRLLMLVRIEISYLHIFLLVFFLFSFHVVLIVLHLLFFCFFFSTNVYFIISDLLIHFIVL